MKIGQSIADYLVTLLSLSRYNGLGGFYVEMFDDHGAFFAALWSGQ